jgi:hypothetical protein
MAMTVSPLRQMAKSGATFEVKMKAGSVNEGGFHQGANRSAALRNERL